MGMEDKKKKMNMEDKEKMDMEEKKKYFLPCADDNGKPMCFICKAYFPTIKDLYGHMKHDHSNPHWFEILPEEPSNSVIIVCRTLLPLSPTSDQSNDEKESFGNYNEVVDLSKNLSRWGESGRRGRPALRNKSMEVGESSGQVVFDLQKNPKPLSLK